MFADYHVHTPYCGHAKGTIIEYIESAIRFGFQEIGFADHLGRYYLSTIQKRRYWDWGMSEKNINRYISELIDLKEIYKNQITIKIGLEIDYIEGAEELLLRIIDPLPLDFSIGSIHCLPHFSWEHLSKYSGKNFLQLYKEYFSQARSALQSNLFSTLGHLDYIWRLIPLPQNEHEFLISELNRTIRTAAQSNTCIEINANGYLWSYTNKNRLFEMFLGMVASNQTAVTMGSDAHEPLMVGKCFNDLIEVLQQKGISSMCCFSNKNRQIWKIG